MADFFDLMVIGEGEDADREVLELLRKAKGEGWDKFVRKLGDPPVIFDEASVRISQENIRSHLEYIGYYGSEVQSDVVTKGKEVTVT